MSRQIRATVWILLSIILLACDVSAAADFIVDIYETGKVTSYYEDYYIVQVMGNVSLINTQNYSLFNIDIPFELPGLHIRLLNGTDRFELTQNSLSVYGLDPNENITFEYRISGITSDWFRTDQAVFKTAIEDATDMKIYSNLMGSLKKSEILI